MLWFQQLSIQPSCRYRTTKGRKARPTLRASKLETLENRNLLTGYMQMNLVSDQAGAALIQDPQLIAPWGITIAPDGNFWVADSGSSVATIYSGAVNGQAFAKNSLVVDVPGGLPTGVVANSSGGFNVTGPDGSTGSSQVAFDSANGNLAGWSPNVPSSSSTSTLAQLAAQVDGAVYTGLAIGTIGGTTYLFAADFQNGTIDVFDNNFNLVTSLSANAHPGYSPFGVQVIDGQLYVTYAQYKINNPNPDDNDADDHGPPPGPQNDAHDNGNGNGNGNGHGPGSDHGHHGPKGPMDNDDDDGENAGTGPSGVRLLVTTGGFVDAYAMSGLLSGSSLPTATWSSGAGLNAPWGLALAPSSFGDFGGDLLVGDFGDGHITALNPSTGAIVTTTTNTTGELTNADGTPIVIPHLLGLTFGNGTTAGDAGTLFFTSAPTGSTGPATSSNPSLVVLDNASPGALTASGNANVAVSGGGTIAVDSSSPSAITANGNAQVAAGTIDVVGSTSANGNANIDGMIDTGAAAVADPLASLAAPSTVGLPTFTAIHISDHSHVTLQPGVYTGGISVTGQASVFLMPGVYILQGGGLKIAGGATVVGNGVTIFNNPQTANDSIHVSGHGSLVLSGPSSGPLQGIAIFQARGAGSPISVDGQGLISVQGIVYAPNAPVEVAGNGQLIVSNDLDDNIRAQLIVFDVNVTGNGSVVVSGTGVNGAISGIHGLLGSLQPATTANPLVITGGAINPTEGTTFTGAVAAIGSAVAGAVPGNFSATINWGDGTSSAATLVATGNGGFLVDGSHAYSEEGTETISVTVSDNAGHTVSSTGSAQVADAPLVATPLTIPVQSSLTVSGLQIAAVTDTGGAEVAGNYTATIDWGDGMGSTGTVSITGNTVNVAGSHTFSVAGRYHVTITVQDEGGASTVVHSIVVVGSPPANNLFIASAFDDVLQRPVDTDTLQGFSNLLQNGLSRAAFATTLTHSDEFLDDLIDQAYLAFLGRDADDAGRAFWLGLMKAGLTIEQLDADFIGTPEFFEHAGGTNQLFVEHMFFDVLGRAPDTAGETFWVNALAGGASRALVALGFADSDEHEGIIVRDDYETFLDRAPGASEVNFWVGQFAHGVNNEDVVAGFIASPEYFNVHSQD